MHLIGRCPRVPYVHYREAEEMGTTRPPPHTYNAICGDCWPSKSAPLGEDTEEEEVGDDAVNSAAESSSDDDDELMTPL